MIYKQFLKQSIMSHVLSIKWVLSFVCLTALSLYASIQIQTYSYTTGQPFNIFDVFFYQFGLYMYVFLVISPIFIALISNISINHRMDNYIYARFPVKHHVWSNKIFLLIILAFLFLIKALVINLIIGFSSVETGFNWSTGVKLLSGLSSPNGNDLHYIGVSFFGTTPVFTMFVLLGLLFCYLFFIGLVTMCVSFFCKKAFYGFLVGIIFNFSTLILLKIDYLFEDFPYLLYHKLLLQYQKPVFHLNTEGALTYTFLYWFFLITITATFSFFLFTKSDYVFEAKDYD